MPDWRNVPLAPAIQDVEVDRRQAELATIGGLTDLKWQPALRAAAHLSLIEERCYQNLKGRELENAVDGEICSSVDTVRKLISEQMKIYTALGLTPNSEASPDAATAALPAVFKRIEEIRKTRQKHARQSAKAKITGIEPA